MTHIAGVDEAGRGPLAGPVVAAAVIFDPRVRIDRVNDSKKLSARVRASLYDDITGRAIAWGVGIVDHEVIDRINILNATFLAMHKALRRLAVRPDHLIVDGNQFRTEEYPYTTVIDGDARCFSIAAASIIAKVTRDRLMVELDVRFPEYGFARHKGYGTREHIAALLAHGPSPIHRRSFLKKILSTPQATPHAPAEEENGDDRRGALLS